MSSFIYRYQNGIYSYSSHFPENEPNSIIILDRNNSINKIDYVKKMVGDLDPFYNFLKGY